MLLQWYRYLCLNQRSFVCIYLVVLLFVMTICDDSFRSSRPFEGEPAASLGPPLTASARLPYARPTLRILSMDELNAISPTHFLSVKYLFTSDVNSLERESFVEEHLPGATFAKYRLISDILPRTDQHMDVVIVSGNDSNRLASFMKVNLPILRRTPVLAVGSTLSPRRRAELLRLGYDDVVNVGNLSGDEFAARVIAICRRHRMTRQIERDLSEFHQTINRVCAYDAPSGAQRRVIEVLVRAKGGVCSYGVLRNTLAGDYYDASLSNLRVVIHNIKRHLRGEARIENVRSEGYKLVAPPAPFDVPQAGHPEPPA